ncbi:uncharacterized protein EV420DRAFT_1711200 [Desarmillaria tabescens]|uniref:F-box domain-containing protein n=1 Tax=Armillaria tabescens TaxID=1929756 RepID=A0AA39JWW6_ARMTA|nr:uncharacterized protein EV420DRAFT_1711200 [Desarmillaria tabescens]KAK0448929.1 hypothetical protein EV420DRAFT_1711200 [Desarmillaria tabescens]
MPLDVLLEIFGHLLPYDVLRLARLTKEFRRLLMHPSSRSCWRASLSNVPNLPDTFPGMTEPAWVNLVFHPQCHVYLPHFLHESNAKSHYQFCSRNMPVTVMLAGMLPMQIDRSEPPIVPMQLGLTCPKATGRKHILRQDFHDLANQFKLTNNPQEKELFKSQKSAMAREIEQRARECLVWTKCYSIDQLTEIIGQKANRLRAIHNKLVDLGWTQELDFLERQNDYHILSEHRFVDQTRPLTDRIWTRIEPAIIELLQDVRVRRLQAEHDALIRARKNVALSILRTYKRINIPFSGFMPECPDYFEFPDVRAIIHRPPEETIDHTSFEHIPPLLPDLIEAWRDRVHEELYALIKDSDPTSTIDEREALHLATTIFTCETCTHIYHDLSDSNSDLGIVNGFGIMTYPGVLSHKCLTRGEADPADIPAPIEKVDAIVYVSNKRSNRLAWSSHTLRIIPRHAGIAEDIVIAAGKDPKTTSAVEMDQLLLYFFCMDCATFEDVDRVEQASGKIWKWRLAFRHILRKHYTSGKAHWCILTPNQILQYSLEPPSKFLTFRVMAGNYLCKWCLDSSTESSPVPRHFIQDHIRARHDIDDPAENSDYIRVFGTPPDRSGAFFTARLKAADVRALVKQMDSGSPVIKTESDEDVSLNGGGLLH